MDLENMLHKTPAAVDPKPGQLLLAAPMMTDPNFIRTAILILDRQKDGSHLGIIMNRRSEANLGLIFNDVENAERIPLFYGGPVGLDRMLMLHRLGSVIEGSEEIFKGVYSGGNISQIKDYIASGAETEGLIRFYLGYAGWDEDQLSKEILENSWGLDPDPDPDLLLQGEGFDYWTRDVRNLGLEYKPWLNIPIHPSLN